MSAQPEEASAPAAAAQLREVRRADTDFAGR